MTRPEEGRQNRPAGIRHAGDGRIPGRRGRGGDARRGAGGPRLDATWGRPREVSALRADGLQVEIADRQNDVRLQPGAPHQAARRAHRRLGGRGSHQHSQLQRQQQGPREAAHGRLAAAVQLSGGAERRGGGPPPDLSRPGRERNGQPPALRTAEG